LMKDFLKAMTVGTNQKMMLSGNNI
jgi:hypothetical protein